MKESLLIKFAIIAFAISVAVYMAFGPSSVGDAPEWCQKSCSGHVDRFYPTETIIVTRCVDGAFYDQDDVKACAAHKGLDHQTNIGPTHAYCFCSDGALFRQ
jgi:hypothetical protein